MYLVLTKDISTSIRRTRSLKYKVFSSLGSQSLCIFLTQIEKLDVAQFVPKINKNMKWRLCMTTFLACPDNATAYCA